MTGNVAGMVIDRARQLADDVLFPAAIEVDRAERVPADHFDRLAAAGLYGVAGRDDLDFRSVGDIVAALAGGCMATAFVWIQHFTPVRALRGHAVAERFLPALVAGERRGGIALAGVRPPKNYLRVRREGSEYVLDGMVPWVTGWGMIDTLYVAARDTDDRIHFLLVDAAEEPAVTAETQRIVAVQASNTVNLSYTGHRVPADRLLEVVPFDEWQAGDAFGSAMNGFLAIGLAERCVRLLREGPGAAQAERLAAELEPCAAALAGDDQEGVPAARAATSELAWRAAGLLSVMTGARSVLLDNHAQRLVREAAFLLVFGSRPAIRDDLAARLHPPG